MWRKGKLKTIEIQISKALINLYISCDEFVSVNNVLREYNKKRWNKKSWNFCGIYYVQWKHIASVVKIILETKFQVS